MRDILEKLHYHSFPGPFEVEIPGEVYGLRNTISGTLEVSKSGYVYSKPLESLVRLKFLALGLYLPLKGITSKCIEIVKKHLGYSVAKKGFHDLEHVFKIAKIAWSGALNLDSHSLIERVEKLALAELEYNNKDPAFEMHRPRSDRLNQGIYAAKCMQPLFHRDQYSPVVPLKEKIEKIDLQQKELEQILIQKQSEETKGSFLNSSYLFIPFSSSYKGWNSQKIILKLQELHKLNATLKKQLETSKKCQNYTQHAIFNQQCFPHTLDASTETQGEFSCFGKTCFKQQRICGLLYKIECCANRCWAIDCFCCMCCIWPEAQSVCLIT